MFIDAKYAKHHKIPLFKKSKPRPLTTIDGTPILGGDVTHEAHVVLNIGNHQELIPLDVTTLGYHNIVLGLPWLKHHNPTVDWTEHHVKFNSNYCQSHCLKSCHDIYGVDYDEIIAKAASTKSQNHSHSQ